jgi:hypothetical protein
MSFDMSDPATYIYTSQETILYSKFIKEIWNSELNQTTQK